MITKIFQVKIDKMPYQLPVDADTKQVEEDFKYINENSLVSYNLKNFKK